MDAGIRSGCSFNAGQLSGGVAVAQPPITGFYPTALNIFGKPIPVKITGTAGLVPPKSQMFGLLICGSSSAFIPIRITYGSRGGAKRRTPGTKPHAIDPGGVTDSSIPSGSECTARIVFRWCRFAQPPATVCHPYQDESM